MRRAAYGSRRIDKLDRAPDEDHRSPIVTGQPRTVGRMPKQLEAPDPGDRLRSGDTVPEGEGGFELGLGVAEGVDVEGGATRSDRGRQRPRLVLFFFFFFFARAP